MAVLGGDGSGHGGGFHERDPLRLFSFSRDLEFAAEPELAKRMGCGRQLWLRAAVKELIDNALDDAEENGIAPEITVEVDVDGNRLTVADNGSGMPQDLVERICVRSERTIKPGGLRRARSRRPG